MFDAFFLITQHKYLLKWRNTFSIQASRGMVRANPFFFFFTFICSVFALYLVSANICFLLKGKEMGLSVDAGSQAIPVSHGHRPKKERGSV